MITVTFQADTFDDLVSQVTQFMGLNIQAVPVKEVFVGTGGVGGPAGGATPVQAGVEPASKTGKSRPSKTKTDKLEPSQPHPDLIEKEPQPEPDEEQADAALVGGVKEDTVALEAMKNQQLDRLRDLFSAGKVKFVRELLATYGGGAKVFPEVDALAFPAIKKAIDKEMGLQ